MKNNAHRGFTLAEVLMVIVIIGALAGFTYLTLGKSDEGVKSKACGGNREAIKMAYSMYLFDSGKKSTEYTLQNFIDDKYQGIVENNKTTCPSDGTYSAESATFNTVVCSKHKDEISSYTYRADSWADMDEDRAAFLSQLAKDIQSAYSKLAELFPNHAARLASLKELAGGTNITVSGEALRVMDEITKLTAQLNLSSFLSTST
ncbi:MAG: prepilin-type N-terminal cleavage/methylation domain-containing protein, partial [Synergistaceae bacterium]